MNCIECGSSKVVGVCVKGAKTIFGAINETTVYEFRCKEHMPKRE